MAGERANETTASIVVPSHEGREAMIQASLVGISGSVFGSRFVLGDEPVVLGRDPDACDILVEDGGVSRVHARIERDGRGYRVIDCESKNGTLVDGVPITDARLRDGQLVTIGGCVLKYLRSNVVELQYHDRMSRLSQTDELTGVPNRRFVWNQLSREIGRARRHGLPLALIMFDIDHFKRINDTFGHAAGDACLIAVASTASDVVRDEDVLARIGGEEFLVVLPHASLPAAADTAHRIREAIEALVIETDGHQLRLTVSLGVSDLSVLRDAVSEDVYENSSAATEAFVALTDARLYDAKRAGRNRVAT
jgi:diguanylate cyclase (GGDEF)-like protein